MKLLFCHKCEDVFRLVIGKMRSCECGAIKGRYINNSEAEVSKDAVSIAIGNGSFQTAMWRMLTEKGTYTREQWQAKGGIIAWVRPNDGPGNPHTTIIKE